LLKLAVNKYSFGFAIWLYLSVLYFVGMTTRFYLFFIVKNNAVQHRSNVKWCQKSGHSWKQSCRGCSRADK